MEEYPASDADQRHEAFSFVWKVRVSAPEFKTEFAAGDQADCTGAEPVVGVTGVEGVPPPPPPPPQPERIVMKMQAAAAAESFFAVRFILMSQLGKHFPMFPYCGRGIESENNFPSWFIYVALFRAPAGAAPIRE